MNKSIVLIFGVVLFAGNSFAQPRGHVEARGRCTIQATGASAVAMELESVTHNECFQRAGNLMIQNNNRRLPLGPVVRDFESQMRVQFNVID